MHRINKKAMFWGLALIILGIICGLGNLWLNNLTISGATFFRESFILIPVGWILMGIGCLILVVAAFIAIRKNDMNENKSLRKKNKEQKNN
ncbi:hypothetical protein FP435_01860 [Lactobacillus sp. PV037]|uniref:hypothetical protein n=1 Tax=unclassified Lactobacillus TaxID=2620435 RepID=UPI00223EB883|nr:MULTISPECIES: hypothetical protein [unclassified Lactobacillus]QNQ82620.1 hypothetical protein FP433_05965 [Lactobacillus sp. PV012]QNQ83267.1 hypothetical protein FP435_01860 [Lactobacillus sp. PV037]